jgi:hypothetical protein
MVTTYVLLTFELTFPATLASTFEFMLSNIICVIARLNQHF